MSKELKIDKAYLHEMYNATCKENPEGSDEIESYENWLERQLISRITTTPTKTAEEFLKEKNIWAGTSIETEYPAEHPKKKEYYLENLLEEYASQSHPQPTEVTEGEIERIAKDHANYFKKSLREKLGDLIDESEYNHRANYIYLGFKEGIRKGLSMKGGGDWISVEERLPITEIGKAEQVIVLSDKKDGSEPLVICAVFWNGSFYLQESWGHKETKSPLLKYTTHWQPLPKFTQSK